MAALLGGATGAAGAGAMGAAGAGTAASTAATTAATAAPAAYGAGTYGVMANNAAPAAYQLPTAPSNYVMQSSQGPAAYTVPQATGGMMGEAPGNVDPRQSFMARLMEYAKRNPSQAPDRSMPSAPNAQQAPPPMYSHLLGESGHYPTLASLMAVQLPGMQTRG